MNVRLTREAYPPLYGIRAADILQPDVPPLSPECPAGVAMYLGGYLTEAGRAEAVRRNGWRVVE